MLDREEHKLVLGTTIAVVTGIMTEELAATMLRLSRRGHKVTVLSTSGETWNEQLGHMPVRDLSHVEDVWSAAP
jgi:putative intracellular protease/amidase